MADLDYQLDQDSNKVSTIGCISPKAKIIISISIVAIFLIALNYYLSSNIGRR